jgi:hypothetical protein
LFVFELLIEDDDCIYFWNMDGEDRCFFPPFYGKGGKGKCVVRCRTKKGDRCLAFVFGDEISGGTMEKYKSDNDDDGSEAGDEDGMLGLDSKMVYYI